MCGWQCSKGAAMFEWFGKLFGVADKALDVAKEATVDKDRVLQLAQDGKDLELQAYVAELSAKTIPWVDALHKMGRLLTQWLLIGMGILQMMTGKQLSEVVWLTIGGPVALYTWMKGRGK